jgi:hypothetical protein
MHESCGSTEVRYSISADAVESRVVEEVFSILADKEHLNGLSLKGTVKRKPSKTFREKILPRSRVKIRFEKKGKSEQFGCQLYRE